jgi:guanylate kinase
MNKTILTLTGPSASGKTTLESLLCDAEGSIFERVISTTTRAPRPGEVERNAYHFVSLQEFARLEAEGQLMESVQFNGTMYGATVSEFERIFSQGKIAVLVCEPVGRAQIEDKAFELQWATLAVFVSNPAHVRFKRLLDRFLLDPNVESFAQRLVTVTEVESKWHEDAWQYDVILDAFNESNKTAVVNHISAMALNTFLKGYDEHMHETVLVKHFTA